VLVLTLSCSQPQPPTLQQGTLLPQAKLISDFSLIDHNGTRFGLDRFKNHWTFTFFGYTHCPDVCPTSMAMLAQVQNRLEEAGTAELPRVVFFSVDPQRDTPATLATYVPYFHSDFLGVTGDPDEIFQLSRQLGILYGKTETENEDSLNYLVDHSASIILFDPEGGFRALFGPPHDPAKIAADFLAIRDYYEEIR
jgi:protein SCO1/2